MKVIFLDVDGVLNHKEDAAHGLGLERFIDDEKVALLRQMVEQTRAVLVLSSSWRRGWTAASSDKARRLDVGRAQDYFMLCAKLSEFGLDLLSETPVLPGMSREKEIQYWLSCWDGDPVERFVILDDEEGAFAALRPHLVLTSLETGLLPAHVEAVKRMLA